MFSAHLRTFIMLMALLLIALAVTRWLIKDTDLYEPFERRRNYWIFGTVILFLVPNFWLSMILMGALFGYLARKDPYPVSIYLMFMMVAPPIHRALVGFGPISYVLDLNLTRMLALTVLLPLGVSLLLKPSHTAPQRSSLAKNTYRVTDTIVILYTLYLLALYVPHEPVTTVFRRFTHMSLDLLLPYFVVSRCCKDRKAIFDGLGAMVVTALILAQIAVFEHFKGWLMYGTITDIWDAADFFGGNVYLMRDTALRALVSTGHALVLGHYLVVTIGLAGLLLHQLPPKRMLLVMGVLLLGLYSTVSRGPWLSGALVILMMGIFHPKASKFYLTVAGATIATVALVAISPWSEKIVNYLPFVGQVDQFNVDYRKQLLDTTFLLVSQKPLFGSVLVFDQLEHLRQGQGIIDLVNVYATVALNYGLIGLVLFVLIFLTSMGTSMQHQLAKRKMAQNRRIFELVGFTAVALVGSMVTLAGIADFLSVPLVYTVLIAMLVAISRLPRSAPAPAAR